MCNTNTVTDNTCFGGKGESGGGKQMQPPARTVALRCVYDKNLDAATYATDPGSEIQMKILDFSRLSWDVPADLTQHNKYVLSHCTVVPNT